MNTDASIRTRPMSQVLLVDDDAALCELLAEYLAAEGFSVTAVHDGDAGLDAARAAGFDVLLLDVMLPRRGGFDVLRALRPGCGVPVIMLTARGEDVDRIVGLELGADDYIAKPFNPRELVARIRAVLRRARPAAASIPILAVEDIEVRMGERVVRRAGGRVDLTSTEFDVLATLMTNAGRTVSKREVSTIALGRDFGRYDRAVDMHVSRLRRKLGPRADGSERIKTVRGSGYLYVLATLGVRS
jgi:two-component system response regulator CpxR